ncbi:hypothetical protein K1719_029038 [Acacia pycnantha]|nr:hypothetical protein K1719_029038 [Acacia pycnantha]
MQNLSNNRRSLAETSENEEKDKKRTWTRNGLSRPILERAREMASDRPSEFHETFSSARNVSLPFASATATTVLPNARNSRWRGRESET